MIKKINVAGIELDNYNVHESIELFEKLLLKNAFATVQEVVMETLLTAKKNEEVHQAIEQMSLTVIAENEILTAAGQHSIQRKHEIENNEFFYQVMKRVGRNHLKVFLLGDTLEDVQRAETFILEQFADSMIVGGAAMKACLGESEGIVNEINACEADIVISLLPSPEQEQFLLSHKDKISAKMWYGTSINHILAKNHKIRLWIRKHIGLKRLREYSY